MPPKALHHAWSSLRCSDWIQCLDNSTGQFQSCSPRNALSVQSCGHKLVIQRLVTDAYWDTGLAIHTMWVCLGFPSSYLPGLSKSISSLQLPDAACAARLNTTTLGTLFSEYPPSLGLSTTLQEAWHGYKESSLKVPTTHASSDVAAKEDMQIYRLAHLRCSFLDSSPHTQRTVQRSSATRATATSGDSCSLVHRETSDSPCQRSCLNRCSLQATGILLAGRNKEQVQWATTVVKHAVPPDCAHCYLFIQVSLALTLLKVMDLSASCHKSQICLSSVYGLLLPLVTSLHKLCKSYDCSI